jgi:hypothetical protein
LTLERIEFFPPELELVNRSRGLRALQERQGCIRAPGQTGVALRNLSSGVPSKQSGERWGIKETKLKNKDAEEPAGPD